MSIDFIPIHEDEDERIDLSNRGWSQLFELAIQNGWEPMGTVEPYGEPCEDWCGTYFSSDFQLVREVDILNMADALERAIAGRDPDSVAGIQHYIDAFRRSGGIMLG